MPNESQSTRDQRDAAIEHLTCTFGISFNALLSKLYWGKRGAPVGNVLARLAVNHSPKDTDAAENSAQVRIEKKIIPGGLNLVLPTASTAVRLGYPKNRSVLPGTAGVNDRIAFACFCFFSSSQNVRWPIRPEHIHSIYPEAKLVTAHRVITEEFDSNSPTVLEIVQSISALERKLTDYEQYLGQHIARGDFGFAILSSAAEQDEAEVIRKKLRRRARRILVAEAVTSDRLAVHIKELRGENS